MDKKENQYISYNLPVKNLPKDTTFVFTINSEVVHKYAPYLVGYCNNYTHKGFLTKTDIDEHRCTEKNCPFLMKAYGRDDYWDEYFEKLEMKEAKREEKRQKQREYKLLGQRARKNSDEFIARGNTWLRNRGYEGVVEITGIRYDKPTKTTVVTYVADRRLDEFEFADLLTHCRVQVGSKTLLTRIRNEDKSYATLEEWHNSQKYKEFISERDFCIENK